jgi:hypothetical protein
MEEAIGVLSVILTPLIITAILVLEPSHVVGGFWLAGTLHRRDRSPGASSTAMKTVCACKPVAHLAAKCHLAEPVPYLAFTLIAPHLGWSAHWLGLRVQSTHCCFSGWAEGRDAVMHLPPVLFRFAAAAASAFPLRPRSMDIGRCAARQPRMGIWRPFGE